MTFEILKAIEIDTALNPSLSIKCAILHDTIEDTKLTIKEVENRFGKNIADGVLALTKNEQDTTVKDKMLDSLARIKKQPKEVWVVKMADRVATFMHLLFIGQMIRKKRIWKRLKLFIRSSKVEVRI